MDSFFSNDLLRPNIHLRAKSENENSYFNHGSGDSYPNSTKCQAPFSTMHTKNNSIKSSTHQKSNMNKKIFEIQDRVHII